MQKKYLKLNENDEHLSLGNLFRLIKSSSKNKISALQSELFCSLFEIEDINDTTVNNYCVGCRSIGGEYKQIFINKQKKYQNNHLEFTNNILSILSIMDGTFYQNISNPLEFINNSSSATYLAQKLYNLAKNDNQVSIELSDKYYNYLKNNNIYECLVEELIFIVLEKKQPLYEDELKKEVLETVLNDTSISSSALQEYLSLKLTEGINFDYAMKKLATDGNAYANFEIGSNEYYGFVKGYPRYDEAYKYLNIAASLNHAGANYMIGNMFVRGLLGSKQNDELKKGYDYLKKACSLGSIAATNTIGTMYLDGIYPLKKDIEEAKKYFNEAIKHKYAYAYNNLGRIYEDEKDYEKAFSSYLESADLGESWACNKVGEWYRKGTVKYDMEKAFYYYNKALDSNCRMVCNYAYYNLAKYFYLNGYSNIVLKKDLSKSLEYLTIASNSNIIEATIELLYLKVKEYLSTRNNQLLNDINDLKTKIETNPKYNKEIGNKITKELNILKEKSSFTLDI